MTPILTITLNPALDLATATDRVIAEGKLRCDTPVTDPGGGGVNVARAVHLLGGTATAWVALGGATGQRLAALLQAEGIRVRAFQTPGETRESLSVTERGSGAQYRFVLPGPVWDAALAARALSGLTLPQGAIVVLSGSQPPGLAADFPAQLARLCDQRGAMLVLDTSGPPLAALPDAPLGEDHVLRLDQAESAALAGHALNDRAALADFARAQVARGLAGTVILALGAEGSVLANRDGAWHAVTPRVPVSSKIGAGDSFVGAFVLALSGGAKAPQALAHGVAGASAAVMSAATALCARADYERLLPQVVLTPL